MEFKEFNSKIKEQFTKMCKTGKLFRANVSGDELWEQYLGSFEDSKIFRDPESSEHNCNCCKNFIRRYGNIVAIIDSKLESMFTGLGDVGEYTASVNRLNEMITSVSIQGVFFETYETLNQKLNYESCNKNQDTYKLGIETNYKKYTQEEADKFGVVNTEEVYQFDHFCIDLPRQFVDFSGRSVESISAFYRDKYNVFLRAMLEIPRDTLQLVSDLIIQGSLLDGTAHHHAIADMIVYKSGFDDLRDSGDDVEMLLWGTTYGMDERLAKFKNTLIGVLCSELAEGMELNKACLNWNKRVDPTNYHRAKAPITQKQINETQSFVEDNGYTESFNRKLATIDDIKASEILHMNSDGGSLNNVSIFDSVKPTSTRHKRANFDKIEEVSIDKFMKDILPSCTSMEAYLENRMEGNLVTLTTSKTEDSKPIFKWDNNYSWTFNGNLAGKSYIKDAVAAEGGKVDGVLRFSLMWAEGDPTDDSDLDAHCKEPTGHIHFSRMNVSSGGNLDIDITRPVAQRNNKNVAENITWPSLDRMQDGKYEMIAHNFADRGNKYFEAEIEFNGNIYNYRYDSKLSGYKTVAVVTLKNGEFSIEHKMPEMNSTRTVWGLETNTFHKVNLACLSPNHWGNNAVGNKHYMFMLDNCKAENDVRGFHNENLNSDLLKHRKVMEVLGNTALISPTEKHLAGLGFNSTVRDELIVKVKGSFSRTIKIKF